jgi:hypothetical protein
LPCATLHALLRGMPYTPIPLDRTPNLGEVTVRTYYSGYPVENGLQAPFGYTSVIDWRNPVVWRFFVDRVKFGEPVALRTAAAPIGCSASRPRTLQPGSDRRLQPPSDHLGFLHQSPA